MISANLPYFVFAVLFLIGLLGALLETNLIKIGITGSYGKTTTKNIMGAILSEQYNTLITPASYNTPMGITRTIREMLKPIHQVFVCEMGADHVGDITYLMEFIRPQIGTVTSIGPQHLETFHDIDTIVDTKFELADALPSDGLLFLNGDNEYIRKQSEGYKNRIFYCSCPFVPWKF